MLRILLVIFFVMYSNLSLANGWIKGLGAGQCGDVLSTVKRAEKNDIEWVSMMYIAWMQGYLSGIDSDTSDQISRLKNVSKDSLYYSVINRCKDEPLEDFYEAVLWVYLNKL